jgi:hypothetical protein
MHVPASSRNLRLGTLSKPSRTPKNFQQLAQKAVHRRALTFRNFPSTTGFRGPEKCFTRIAYNLFLLMCLLSILIGCIVDIKSIHRCIVPGACWLFTGKSKGEATERSGQIHLSPDFQIRTLSELRRFELKPPAAKLEIATQWIAILL